MNRYVIALAAAAFAGPVLAEGTGDAEAGEKGFKKCKSCHMIVADDGTVVVKGGKTGPNLYGVIGRTAGSFEGFKYGKSTVAAGEAGLVWDEEQFLAYMPDPKKFLRTYLDDSSAKSKMSFRLKKGGEDIYAYLVSVGPE
jgi:cytochrome c